MNFVRHGPLGAFTAAALALCPSSRTQDHAAAPSRAAVESLVARFDAAFNARALDELVALFVPVHPEQTERTLDRLRKALGGTERLERTSQVAEAWPMGRHAIALVRATTLCAATQGRADEAVLVAAREVDGALRIALAVEVDPGVLAMLPRGTDERPRGTLHCPACNYRIEAGDDWLAVPARSQRVGCYESLSFWSLERDLVVMVSVHLARVPEPAIDWLLRLGRELGTPSEAAPTPWLPPRYAALDPATRTLAGARARFVEPLGERVLEVSLLTFGRVAWLFVARGSASDCESQRSSLETLYAGFALDDVDLAPDKLAASIERHHFGTRCDGGCFAHAESGVRFDAPSGFAPLQAGGFARFDVAWDCPEGRATLRLRGLAPPEGLAHWSAPAADAMLARTFQRGALTIAADSGWTDGQVGFARERRIELRDAAGELVRILRVTLDDDLCVVLEARTTGALDATHARDCLGKLRRER